MIDKILSIISIIGWLIVIYLFSSMPSTNSNGRSKELLKTIVVSSSVILQRVGIIDEVPSNDEINLIVAKINLPARKVAHFSIFFVLSLIVCFALRLNTHFNLSSCCLASLLFCFMYSLFDEYHQTFVNGRTGQFIDCMIDTLGAFVATLLFWIFSPKSRSKQKSN